MGVKITELLEPKEIEIAALKDKIIAVDASNHLYMFLSSIRGRDGNLLTDSKGQVTSHLTGLFTRSANLIRQGVKLAYVFDGEAPMLKQRERERRKKIKIEAQIKYEEAADKGNIEDMKKYGSRTSRLSSEMIEEAKKLVKAMGMPVVEAPSEGEAQAAYLTKKGDAYAISSQDADSLLFGATRIVRNLSITGRRKIPGKLAYTNINPELIICEDVLQKLEITNEQLIILAILTGTDYNPGGIKGIGQKKALKLVKEYDSENDSENDSSENQDMRKAHSLSHYDKLFKTVKWDEHFDFGWQEVYAAIKGMKVTDKYELKWTEVNAEQVRKLLIDEHDFSRERVESTLKSLEETKQHGLNKWF